MRTTYAERRGRTYLVGLCSNFWNCLFTTMETNYQIWSDLYRHLRDRVVLQAAKEELAAAKEKHRAQPSSAMGTC